METINVTPLIGRTLVPYGIKIERDNVIGIISFRDEPRLGFIKNEQCSSYYPVIKGSNFEIEGGKHIVYQWNGEEVTFEELWEKVFKAWNDYQECMTFLSVVFGGCRVPIIDQ